VYFSGSVDAIVPKDEAAIRAVLDGRAARAEEDVKRHAFLERLKSRTLDLPADLVFLQDVEALALGKTAKSRALREAGFAETPQDAHRLLLQTGVWDVFADPFPAREGVSLKSAKAPVPPPPEESRVDLRHLGAYAIDNEDSADPDDALSFALEDGARTLYVHIADPAAGVLPDSEADVEARGRGATVYLPEGVNRMLHDQALAYYALGLGETSPALTFKLKLDAQCFPVETSVFPSGVRVTRMSYAGADAVLHGDCGGAAGQTLAALDQIARDNVERRLNAGASILNFPEARVRLDGGEVSIEQQTAYKSGVIVRECMLLAGEGAAQWALGRRLPFPFVSQETGEVPRDLAPGLAGFYQLRRCMRPRQLSSSPRLHWGLGLDVYTQVTSPLRRYTDLLCHQQIRASLAGRAPLDEDQMLARLAVCERAAQAATRAERAASAHWTRVFLSDKIGSEWEAVVLERKGPHALVCIPCLALELHIAVYGAAERIKPNDALSVKIASVKIAEGIINASAAAAG
jgi:exoribonuclease-2